jgi:hypothetical protein
MVTQKTFKETIKKSWEQETLKAIINNHNGDVETLNMKEDRYCNVLHAPYVQGFSEGIQKKLRNFKVGFIPKKSKTLFNHLCHLKQKTSMELKKGVIYAIPCGTCSNLYIGETGQHFEDRRNQHLRDVASKKKTNGFYDHLCHNKKHKIAWEKAVILDEEKRNFPRKIKESIYINAMNPSEKMNKLLNIEKGVNIQQCWMAFNENIRDMIQKKIQP